MKLCAVPCSPGEIELMALALATGMVVGIGQPSGPTDELLDRTGLSAISLRVSQLAGVYKTGIVV